MATVQEEDAATLSQLFDTLLPDLVAVASFYATTENGFADASRRTIKDEDATYLLHTPLWSTLAELQHSLHRLPQSVKQRNDASIADATMKILDALEAGFVNPPVAALNIQTRVILNLVGAYKWLTSNPDSRSYTNLRAWHAKGSSYTHNRIFWLAKTFWLHTPHIAVSDELLQAVETCPQVVKKYLSFDSQPLEQELTTAPSEKRYIAWSNIEAFCNGLESVHRQLKSGWICECSDPHHEFYFATDLRVAPVEESISSKISHDSDGWKQTSLLLRFGRDVLASYQELCKDLQCLVEKPCYTITHVDNSCKPMPFSEFRRSSNGTPKIRQRLCLAVMLSHLYLNLSGGDWWPYGQTSQMVRFTTGHDVSLAFVNLPFVRDPSNDRPAPLLLSCANLAMPSLYTFGLLILEIIMWEQCQSDGEIEQRMKDLVDGDVPNGHRILGVIRECIGYGNSCLRSQHVDDTIRQNPRMRMNFIKVVIRSLEDVLLGAYNLDAATIFTPPVFDTKAPNDFRVPKSKTTKDHMIATNPLPDRKVKFSVDRNSAGGKLDTTRSKAPRDDFTNLQRQGPTTAEGVHESKLGDEADRWLQEVRRLHGLLPSEGSANPVKVAIMDTGSNFHPDNADLFPDRIETYCFMCDPDKPSARSVDEDGHGTHVASIVLDVGAHCKVYACRIYEKEGQTQDGSSSQAITARIAKAIRYAVDVWKVDIVSMSFGFRSTVPAIRRAIQHANDNNVLVLAAAGNSGSIERVRYPASDPNVLCIYAATGHGNMYDGNPTRTQDETNFELLGVAVRGYMPDDNAPQEVRRCGTSQATAVAAGVAALILQIMRDHQHTSGFIDPDDYEYALSQLQKRDGMRRVFTKMCDSNKRDGYNVVEPWRLLGTTKSELEGQSASTDMLASMFCKRIVDMI